MYHFRAQRMPKKNMRKIDGNKLGSRLARNCVLMYYCTHKTASRKTERKSKKKRLNATRIFAITASKSSKAINVFIIE